MQQWYYAINNQQQGPIQLEELRALIANGTLNPKTDLVWNSSMKDWLPAAEIPVLMDAAPSLTPTTTPGPSQDPTQPFTYPTQTGDFTEITPGSEPIMPTACLKRAFNLTVKHIGPLLLITIILFALNIFTSFALSSVDSALGWEAPKSTFATDSTIQNELKFNTQEGLSPVSNIISSIISIFLMLGATRFGLRVVDGKPFSIGMIFSGGKNLVSGAIGYLIYFIMIMVGMIFLIFPGIYLALRFGMYQPAIVDKNLGPIAALKYSWSLTKGNTFNLFIIALFTVGIALAGCIALIIGLLFAAPMISLFWLLAYRWMQYGGRAIMDDPNTGQALLSNLPD